MAVADDTRLGQLISHPNMLYEQIDGTGGLIYYQYDTRCFLPLQAASVFASCIPDQELCPMS